MNPPPARPFIDPPLLTPRIFLQDVEKKSTKIVLKIKICLKMLFFLKQKIFLPKKMSFGGSL